MMNKKLKYILFILVISIVGILIAITIYKTNVILNSRNDIFGKIESVELISNPKEELSISSYINTTVDENEYCFGNDFSSFSDSEKSMKFDLNKYKIYKVTAKFQNNSNMPIIITMNTYIEENQYIVVPSIIPYIEVADNDYENWEYYIFVSKNYTQNDIEKYLQLQGVDFDVVFQKRKTGHSFIVNTKL